MEQKLCTNCGNARFEEQGFGLDVCLGCGLCRSGAISELHQYVNSDRMLTNCTYTRRKRFRKYLMRANRNQSANSVTAETWEHLLKFAPFASPAELHRCLKSAKHLKRKCYDCMPLMCSHLCHGKVPSLSRAELSKAMMVFDQIDQAVRKTNDPMISYLFCLEYILKRIGRGDMVPFINCIKCPKRRQRYLDRLRVIFNDPPEDVLTRLQGKNPRAT